MVVCLPRARKVQAARTGPAGCQRDASAVPQPSRAGALAARRRPFLPHGRTGGRGAKVASLRGAEGPAILPGPSPGSPGGVPLCPGGTGEVPACLVAAETPQGRRPCWDSKRSTRRFSDARLPASCHRPSASWEPSEERGRTGGGRDSLQHTRPSPLRPRLSLRPRPPWRASPLASSRSGMTRLD